MFSSQKALLYWKTKNEGHSYPLQASTYPTEDFP